MLSLGASVGALVGKGMVGGGVLSLGGSVGLLVGRDVVGEGVL